ncbi:MAG: hypothetical protein JWO05_34 [Gemmatimonadetes bacterium]|nr:hypothetical protein [Gemmatimonadota bacterium]
MTHDSSHHVTPDPMDELMDERLRELAQRHYNAPGEQLPLDAMWSAIEGEAFASPSATLRIVPANAQWFRRPPRWLAAAAGIILGVGLGRMLPHGSSGAAPQRVMSVAQVSRVDEVMPGQLQPTANEYLDRTAALLASLPSESRAGGADARFAGRANDLLLTTRLLLDSPAAQDPRFRTLLEDLELVLAQVVNIPPGQRDSGKAEMDLINQALEQHNVIPRLRTAAAALSAD